MRGYDRTYDVDVRRAKAVVIGIALAASLAVPLATGPAASRAGLPPPVPPFRVMRSTTRPVEGRVFTAVLVTHSLDSWKLTCSTFFGGHSIVPHSQDFRHAGYGSDTRSCSFYVPRNTAGKALEVRVHGRDSGGDVYFNPGWRIVSRPASVTAAAAVAKQTIRRAGSRSGKFHFRIESSNTRPVEGRAFTAVLATHLDVLDSSWTFSCSVSFRGRSIVPHVQEFAPKARSCTVYVPRGTAGSGLRYAVTARDSSGNSRHTTGSWRIVSQG